MAEDPDELLSATEAARYLGLRHTSRMRKIARATGMGRQIGHRWVFTRAELDAYAATRRERLELGWQRVRGVRIPAPPDAPDAASVLLSAPEAAALLGVSVKRVYQLAEDGRFGTRHGTGWRFTKAELEAYHTSGRRPRGRPRKAPDDNAAAPAQLQQPEEP